MKDVKELIKLKNEKLETAKVEKLKEIENIDREIEEMSKIDEITNDKDLFSKLTPVESMEIIKKLGVEGEKDQREVVLNLINESLREQDEVENLSK